MLRLEVVMTKWIALAVVVGLAAVMPRASDARSVTTPEASAGVAMFDVGRRVRPHVRPSTIHDPRYYARPVYYRPYPYGVPAPFVFGYGPFW
jgi:hypothetical protein